MAIGLETYDETGKLIIDVTTRLTKLIGYIELPIDLLEGSGEIVNDDFLLGNPFYFTQGNFADKVGTDTDWHRGVWFDNNTQLFSPRAELYARIISVTFTGNKMTYSFTSSHPTWLPARSLCKLYYGVY